MTRSHKSKIKIRLKISYHWTVLHRIISELWPLMTWQLSAITVVICSSCTAEILSRGNNTTMLHPSTTDTASRAADPVSPDVAKTYTGHSYDCNIITRFELVFVQCSPGSELTVNRLLLLCSNYWASEPQVCSDLPTNWEQFGAIYGTTTAQSIDRDKYCDINQLTNNENC